MSRVGKARARALRARAEVGRLRAVGGVSRQVIVDGASIIAWCRRTGASYEAVMDDLLSASNAGGRRLVLVSPPTLAAPQRWSPPHLVIVSTADAPALLFAGQFGSVPGDALPTVVAADVRRNRELLAATGWGAAGVLDIASGRLWSDFDPDRYDPNYSNAAGARAELSAAPAAMALVQAISSPDGGSAHVYVTATWHRDHDAVVVDELAVDNGQRRHVTGHSMAMALLSDVVASGKPIVMNSSLEVLGALHDVGRSLPPAVFDPAYACVVLDPDERTAPPGVGRAWRALLAAPRADGLRAPVDLLLEELPDLHEELERELVHHGLRGVYEDVSATLPILASIERAGFHVDSSGLSADIAHVEAEMQLLQQAIVSGPYASEFRAFDLITAPKIDVARLIRHRDGQLPWEWRPRKRQEGLFLLDRLAQYGNSRAQNIQRLRALDAIHRWMKRLETRTRLRTILEPKATGRWYPRDDALFTIPKHEPEAMLLRKHLVPEPGHVFVAGDYSAFEPRLLAHQCGDRVLVDGCMHGRDVYRELMPVLKVSHRELAKQALLAFLYDRSPRAFAESLAAPIPEGLRIYGELEKQLVILPRFRGHPGTREHARGVFDGEEGEGQARSPIVQPGVQGGGGSAL